MTSAVPAPTPVPSTIRPPDEPTTVPTLTPTLVIPPTTSTSVTPAPVEGRADDAPFLDGGDYIAIGALLVAILAALFSYWAARANQAMVTQQAEANRLAGEEIALLKQHRQEDQDQAAATAAAATAARDAQAVLAATQIAVELSGNGGVEVEVRNESARTVRLVRLIDLVGEHADWRWKPNPYIPTGNQPTARQLRPGERKRIICVFTDEHGELQRMNGTSYSYRVRFTDSDGQRWEVGGPDGPQHVPADDDDLDDAASTDT